jgi:hypothetical protein
MTAEIVKAARENNLAQVRFELYKLYGDLTIYSYPENGFSSLHWAIHHNNSQMLSLLLAKCNEQAVSHRDNSGLTAIEYAVKLGHWNCLNVFLNNPRKLASNTEHSIYGLALFRIIAGEHPNTVSATDLDTYIENLLKAHAPTNLVRDTDGHSLLHLAIERDLPYVVHLLKSYGANLNYQSDARQTPIEFFWSIRNKLNNAESLEEVLGLAQSGFAATQTTESNSVKYSVTQSIIRLKQRYASDMQQPDWVESKIKEIRRYFFDLKKIEETLDETIQAIHCYLSILKSNSRLDDYYCGMRETEVLALIWQAICDTTSAADTPIITAEYINLRKRALVSHLATAQADNLGIPACFTGIIHQIVTALQGADPDIQIHYEERALLMDASEHIQAFVEQHLRTYSHRDIHDIYHGWVYTDEDAAAVKFRRDAVVPVARALRKVYGDLLSDKSIKEITDQFNALPRPRLKNIVRPPLEFEEINNPLYEQLLVQMKQCSEAELDKPCREKKLRKLLHAYLNTAYEILLYYDDIKRHPYLFPELIQAIYLLCVKYSKQELSITETNQHMMLFKHHTAIKRFYNQSSFFIQQKQDELSRGIQEKPRTIFTKPNEEKMNSIVNTAQYKMRETVESACISLAKRDLNELIDSKFNEKEILHSTREKTFNNIQNIYVTAAKDLGFFVNRPTTKGGTTTDLASVQRDSFIRVYC